MSTITPVRRALVSVYDKHGLAELARGLAAAGVEIVSTGSTAAAVRDAGVAVTEVSAVTGFPEVMDGRVKTLHPAVHAGILADRSKPDHVAALDEHGIAAIDLVVVNLYPFADTVAATDDPARIVEMIDIGGPTMVRAAAKNHAHVGVVVDPAEYPALVAALAAGGGLDAATRRRLAAAAFAHTAAYDADVAAWFAHDHHDGLPARMAPVYEKVADLRYGENPHQAAALYAPEGARSCLAGAEQLQGKELSHNNLLDADAAWGMVHDVDDPAVVIVKHMNPAGFAAGAALAEAHPRALAGDPVSAFGGIVAVNRPLDPVTAALIAEIFTEVVVAPAVEPAALEVLSAKKGLRVLVAEPPWGAVVARTIAGGLLVQEADTTPEDPSAWTVPTVAQPDDALLAELAFAWTVAKHAKSNAIVLTRDRAAVGVGAGQMSRVDSVRIAVEKSDGRAAGSVLASDAFFPFRDGPDAAIAAGVVAMISPGGSRRDDEVVAACDDAGIPMVFTGRRHFRH